MLPEEEQMCSCRRRGPPSTEKAGKSENEIEISACHLCTSDVYYFPILLVVYSSVKL